MRNPEYYFGAFKAILNTSKRLVDGDENEATTRLEVVDETLQTLGWAKSDFHPEERTILGSYTDYLLRTSRKPLLVVEAKRVGETFSLPAKLRKRIYKAGFLATAGGRQLREAMHQAADYCNQTATTYAAVTNGWQWIFFRGLALEGQPWTDFDAIVFNGQDDLRDDFIEFWNILAREHVINGSLNRYLTGAAIPVPQFVARPNSALTFDLRAPPRDDAHTIGTLFDNFFDDITTADNGTMLEHCFVDDPALHEYEAELQALLKERLLSLKEEVRSEELEYERLRKVATQPLQTNRAKVVLVVGRVGAGKTTFLTKFFKRLEEEEGYAKFILDLLPEVESVVPPGEKELRRLSRMILERISDHYRTSKAFGIEYDPYHNSTLRTMFGAHVRRLKEGPNADLYRLDPELMQRDIALELATRAEDATELLPLYMKYVSARTRRPFCLIIDNIDRASDEYQRFMYTFAHKLASQVSGIVVISLRETTYWRARQQGFLDTRTSDSVFHVNPPNLKQVISQRIRYIRYQNQHPDKARREMRPFLPNLAERAEYLLRLLLSNDASGRLLVTCLANRSVRRAFWLLKQYALSPFAWHTADESEAGDHILRALMLTQHRTFEEGKSPIVNLFAVPQDVRGAHLLPLRLLAYLDWVRQAGSNDAPMVEDVIDNFTTWGFESLLVMSALKQLVRKGLLESDNRFIPIPSEDETTSLIDENDLEPGNRVSISPAGYYYLEHLSDSSIYNAYCAGDTSWYDEKAYKTFLDEYRAAIQLNAENRDSSRDLVIESECHKLWLKYLAGERRIEQTGMADSKTIAWRAAIQSRLDRIVPTPEAAARGRTENREASHLPQNGRPAQMQLPVGLADRRSDPKEVAAEMPLLSENLAIEGRKFLPRILWGLEFARRIGVNWCTASQIAVFVSEYSSLKIYNTNTARFFRDVSKERTITGNWQSQTKGGFVRYRISDRGRRQFESCFSSTRSAKTA